MSAVGQKADLPSQRSMSGHKGKADLDGRRVKGL